MKKTRLMALTAVAFVPLLLGFSLPEMLDREAATGGDEAALNPVPSALQKPAAPPKKKNVERFKDAKEVLQDMGSMDGLFTLYRYDPKDKKRDPERLLAKIPRKLLGDDMLLAMSLSRGAMAGFQWGDRLIRLEIVGDKLALLEPDVRYVRPKNEPVTDAIERTYTNRYLTAVPIAAITPQGDPIIDLEQLLKSDLAGVSYLGGNVRSDLSRWRKVKVFPDNVLVDVELALQGRRGGEMMGVSYSFRRLPKLGTYSPRQADPRVGYFITAHVDWSKEPSARDTFERYIQRWQLEKQDPSLELSPPKEPIVFIIEKTVPIRWRRYVREGIEEWNRAFEKIGFVDAIIVQQQTETNEYAGYDPEDARYNFFRWIVSGSAFAMGPSRVDPRTGQILDADIIFDDAFVRAWMYQFDLYGPTAMTDFAGPGLREWLDEQPELVPALLRKRLEREDADPLVQRWKRTEEVLHARGQCTCGYARGMQQQLALAHLATIATGAGGKELPEQLIGEAIRETVTHEVGHTLGLRHNFKASAWLSLDEIKRRRDETDLPTTASVMDYNPLLFFTGDKLENLRHFVSPCLGPYDEWAIEYGYAQAKGKAEKELLQEITARCTQPELQYATDHDTMWVYSPDPLVNRYDLSSDPLAYAQARINLANELLGNITEWAIQPDEPRYHLLRAFNILFAERARNIEFVARLVGGQYFYRHFPGDPNAKPAFVLVDPPTQRAALEYIKDTVFDADFFAIDPELLNQLAPSRWSHWGASPAWRIDYPIHDNIQMLQAMTLVTLSAPPMLERLYDAELKWTGADKFTTAELIESLRDIIWRQLETVRSEPYTNDDPLLSSIERNLQRMHLDLMIDMLRLPPGSYVPADIQSMVRLAAESLHLRIGRVLGEAELDFASRAHLVECASRIERVLNAQFQAR